MDQTTTQKEKCKNCGVEVKTSSGLLNTLCDKCSRRKSTNTYLLIGFIILIIGFFVGIFMGNSNKIEKLTHVSSYNPKYNEYEAVFNTAIMIYTWIGASLFSSFFFAISSICHRLDMIIDKKDNGA